MSTRMRLFQLHFGFVLPLLALAFTPLSCGGGPTLQPAPPANYKLVWSDEFGGTDGSAPDSSKWTYDIGGNWPGSPDSTTVFPQQMLVDYVRVYTKQ